MNGRVRVYQLWACGMFHECLLISGKMFLQWNGLILGQVVHPNWTEMSWLFLHVILKICNVNQPAIFLCFMIFECMCLIYLTHIDSHMKSPYLAVATSWPWADQQISTLSWVARSGPRVGQSIPGWWFGTCFIFPCIQNHHRNSLIFFRRVQTTNQIHILVGKVCKVALFYWHMIISDHQST